MVEFLPSIVTSYSFDRDSEKLVLNVDHQTRFNLYASAECCNKVWWVCDDQGRDLNDIPASEYSGELLRIECTSLKDGEVPAIVEKKAGEAHDVFIFSKVELHYSNRQLNLFFVSDNNGYYSGWFSLTYDFKPNVIVVTGLPGAGKSYLLKQLQQHGFDIYDDFVDSLWNGKLVSALKEVSSTQRIAIADPRLLDKDVFNMIRSYLNSSKTLIIQFEVNAVAYNRANLALDAINGAQRLKDLENMYQKYWPLRKQIPKDVFEGFRVEVTYPYKFLANNTPSGLNILPWI